MIFSLDIGSNQSLHSAMIMWAKFRRLVIFTTDINKLQTFLVQTFYNNFAYIQDQLRRYVEIKQSDLPSAVAAKKTREFRCPPIEQMKIILGFKNMEEIDDDNRPCSEELISQLREYHDGFVEKLSLDVLQNAEEGGVSDLL